LAAINGHHSVVEYLVNQKADIKIKDGETPLGYAWKSNEEEQRLREEEKRKEEKQRLREEEKRRQRDCRI